MNISATPTIFRSLAIVGLSLSLWSCSKDETKPKDILEQETLTTLELTFTNNSNASDVRKFVFRTADGVQFGRRQQLDTIDLPTNGNYKLDLRVLDESKQTVEDKTSEITTKDLEHQFFFSSRPADLMPVTVSTINKDKNGGLLGTSVGSVLTRATGGTGQFRVILRHEPLKSGNNVANNDTTNAGGETDIAVTYPVRIRG